MKHQHQSQDLEGVAASRQCAALFGPKHKVSGTLARCRHRVQLCGLLASCLLALNAAAQGTLFSYQGRLDEEGSPVTGLYDFTFRLSSQADGSGPVGAPFTVNAIQVSGGLFTVWLDFGATAFDGRSRWLGIEGRTSADPSAVPPTPAGPWFALSPRPKVTPTPYAIYADKASNAINATVAASVGPNAVANGGLQNSAVTEPKIASGQVVKSLNGLKDAVSLTAGANVTLTPSGNSLQISAANGSAGWGLTGNAGITPATQFLGTTDNQPVVVRANNAEVLRVLPSGNVGIGTTAPEKALQVGDVNMVGSEGIIRLASRTSSGAGVGRVWDLGVPQTGDSAAGEGYSFVVRDVNNPGAKPPFMIRYDTHNVGLGTTNPLAKLEIQAGASQDGSFDPRALSLAYQLGGFRHWISSRHNSAPVNNGIDFYLNTSSTSEGSSAPGTGNKLVLSLDSANGVKAVGGLVIENRTSDPPSPANGQIWLRTDL